MKSIVEEASSVAKAIENGWIRAGKPQEFTIRVFEESSGGIFGFFKKSAKVGIFFKELSPVPQGKTISVRQQEKREVSEKSRQKKELPINRAKIEKKQAPDIESQQKWDPQMIESSKEWLQKMLSVLSKKDVTCSASVNQSLLSLTVRGKILDDKRKEQLLYKSLSQLLLQVMRNMCKRSLRDYKIVIMSAA